jgi:hypothetical protein
MMVRKRGSVALEEDDRTEESLVCNLAIALDNLLGQAKNQFE